MATPLALGPRECEGKTWHPPQDVTFAASRALMPLHGGELSRAAVSMPLALIQQRDRWQLVGVCGLTSGRNLFVREGQWLGNYRPEWLVTWPFEVDAQGDSHRIVFNRDSGFESSRGAGEPFFDDRGGMSAAVTSRVQALRETFSHHCVTQNASSALAAAGVITPWPASLKRCFGMTLEGLYMIDETALAELDESSFLALRKARALPIAYALNLSLAQVRTLAQLARLNPVRTIAPENLDALFEGEDEEISFDFDR
ncbi:SapC family protein [Halomonas sp. PAMB 3264]|uniref:SapC family protein n=1 Tax=Halomonas sp. PAMB 3264 TaxID=3075222 RepID=UPI00289BBCB5|nr:SapC family protein [Halomonas sp. PAMB 3264]WNL43446.1 SapC family protein [Halomonas sp. PAMB 3264]